VTSVRVGVALVAALPWIGCAGPEPPAAPRPFEDRERGYRLEVDPAWRVLGDEIQSPGRSLLSVQVNSLVGADRAFVDGLPETLLPQLEGWTRHYFADVGAPEQRTVTIADRPVLEVSYTVRARPRDPPGKVLYWVIGNGERVYTFRTALPASAPAEDEAAARRMIATLAFTD
jgi:hypothetical protein